MNISLVMVTQEGTARELPITRLPAMIGRGGDCKIRVPLASVSRNHCELLEKDDELVVRDLKSSNGTFVNKDRVKARELIPGDLLAVGPIVFVVKIDGHPKNVEPTTAYANGAVSTEGATEAIAGVPTWPGGGAGGGGGGGEGASSDAKTVNVSPPPPARPAATAGPADKTRSGSGKAASGSEDEGVEKLLADLSESDFDIDLGDSDPKA